MVSAFRVNFISMHIKINYSYWLGSFMITDFGFLLRLNIRFHKIGLNSFQTLDGGETLIAESKN